VNYSHLLRGQPELTQVLPKRWLAAALQHSLPKLLQQAALARQQAAAAGI
jgi:hypothetical protein